MSELFIENFEIAKLLYYLELFCLNCRPKSKTRVLIFHPEMLCYVTWGHVTLSAGKYVMSWSKIETVHNSLHISFDYNTKIKISLKFIYFGPIYIVIN